MKRAKTENDPPGNERRTHSPMHAPGPTLLKQLTAFRDALLEMALFDEARCLTVAMRSPSLCDGKYMSIYLWRAADVAQSCGLSSVSHWITRISAVEPRRSAHLRRPLPCPGVSLRRKPPNRSNELFASPR